MHPATEVGELVALEKAMFAAIAARDRQALDRLLADDFELHTPGNPPLARSGFIDAVVGLPGRIISVDSSDLEARTMGDVGIVTGHQIARVELAGGAIETDTQTFVDVTRKHEGRWKLVLAYSAPAQR